MSYPYQNNSTGDFFPIIDLFASHKDRAVRVFALIDSGATISIFREDVADQLGLVVEKGNEIYLGGVGGRIKGYIHELNIEISGKKFLCPVVFSHEYTVSFSLLGRKIFFENFKITFEEKRRQLKLG